MEGELLPVIGGGQFIVKICGNKWSKFLSLFRSQKGVGEEVGLKPMVEKGRNEEDFFFDTPRIDVECSREGGGWTVLFCVFHPQKGLY